VRRTVDLHPGSNESHAARAARRICGGPPGRGLDEPAVALIEPNGAGTQPSLRTLPALGVAARTLGLACAPVW